MIEIRCSHCGLQGRVPRIHAGRRIRCRCGSTVVVPQQSLGSDPEIDPENKPVHPTEDAETTTANTQKEQPTKNLNAAQDNWQNPEAELATPRFVGANPNLSEPSRLSDSDEVPAMMGRLARRSQEEDEEDEEDDDEQTDATDADDRTSRRWDGPRVPREPWFYTVVEWSALLVLGLSVVGFLGVGFFLLYFVIKTDFLWIGLLGWIYPTVGLLITLFWCGLILLLVDMARSLRGIYWNSQLH